MDEKRFTDLMLDELYGELDPDTSAAVRRYAEEHPAAGAKLSSLASTLQATRRIPAPAPPADLEARILARARDSRSLARSSTGVARVVSLAGRWAMKPQTAMAALFVLMIGSSVILVRGRRMAEPAPTRVEVTEQGSPVVEEGTATPEDEAPDPRSAALAHGAEQRRRPAAPPPPAEALADKEAEPLAEAKPEAMAKGGAGTATRASGGLGGIGGIAGSGAGHADAPKKASAEMASAGEEYAQAAPAAPPAGRAAAPAASAPAAAAPVAAAPAPVAAAPVAAAPAANADTAGPAGARSESRVVAQDHDFEGAMAAYGAHDYAGARARFERLAAGGNALAALWAARSLREGSGCAAAAPRFDAVAAKYPGTGVAHDAALEGGRCYRQSGQLDAARSRLSPLLQVPSHADRARVELDGVARAAASGGSRP